MAPAKQDQPISVVMPVHDALPHLDEAVTSILGQSLSDFEFVILDDGSTDGSTERLRYWAAQDPRIKLVESPTRLGPAGSSNRVVAESSGRIVARMDADDVAHSERLRRQLELLDKRQDIGLVGALSEIIDDEGREVRGSEVWRLARSSWLPPFAHGSIMYRRKIFDRIGGYREECVFWEDQDFIIRFSAQSKIAILPLPLYRHRQSPTSTRVASDRAKVERAVDLMYRCLGRMNEGRSYEDLLRAPTMSGQPVDPRVFVSLGSLILWSGRRPRLLRRLLTRAKIGFDMRSMTAIGWTAWAQANPASLRFILKALAAGKGAVRRSRVTGLDAILWQPPRRSPEPGKRDEPCAA